MIPDYQRKANLAVLVWVGFTLLALVSAYAISDGTPSSTQNPITAVLLICGSVAFFSAFWFYLKAKGRSRWWMCLLVFNLIGLLVIFLLKDRTKDVPAETLAPGEIPRR